MYNVVTNKTRDSKVSRNICLNKNIKIETFCWFCSKRAGAVQDSTFPLPFLLQTCVCPLGRVNTSSTLPRKMTLWRKISRQHEKLWLRHLLLADSYQNYFWISQYLCSQSKLFLFLPIPNTVMPKK